MGQIETENLALEQSQLEHKVFRANDVLENIRTPGWINRKNPQALGLRIDDELEPILRFKNRVRVGRIIMTLDEIIPTYQARLDQLTKEIAQAEPEQPTKIESFTNEEAAMLGTLILNKNGVTVKLNGHGIFKFELDEKMVEACQKLEQLPVSRLDYGELTPEEYLKARRESFLQTLEDILQSENVDSIIGSQKNDDVDRVLMWLYYQNEERFFGLLIDFLKSTVNSETTVDGRRGYVESFDRIWQPSAEILAKAGRKKEQVGRKEQAASPPEKPPEEEGKQTVTTSVDPGVVEIEAPPFEQSLLKPRVPVIEKRDPEVREKVRNYIADPPLQTITGPTSQGNISRLYNSLTDTFFLWAEEKKFVRPSDYRGGDKRHPLYTKEQVVLLRYVQHHAHRKTLVNLNPKMIKELMEIIQDEMIQLEAKKAKAN